jgi:hypothetical protein
VYKTNIRVSFHYANSRGRIIIVVAHLNEMQIKRKFPPREHFYLYSTEIVIFVDRKPHVLKW